MLFAVAALLFHPMRAASRGAEPDFRPVGNAREICAVLEDDDGGGDAQQRRHGIAVGQRAVGGKRDHCGHRADDDIIRRQQRLADVVRADEDGRFPAHQDQRVRRTRIARPAVRINALAPREAVRHVRRADDVARQRGERIRRIG